MRISKNFTLEEMEHSSIASRYGLDNTIPDELQVNIKLVAEALQVIRDYYNRPIRISSGYRSEEVNRKANGSSNSGHLRALAVDFTVDGVSNLMVCRKTVDLVPHFDQIIYEFGETGWVHLGLSLGAPRNERLSAKSVSGKTIYTKGFV